MSATIAISMISLWHLSPHDLFHLSRENLWVTPAQAIEDARRLGLAVQGYPLPGMTGEEELACYEDAWNRPVGLWEATANHLAMKAGKSIGELPTLYDWVLFPNPEVERERITKRFQERGILRITHHLDEVLEGGGPDKILLELHSGLNLHAKRPHGLRELSELDQSQYGFVLDTWHLRDHRHYDLSYGDLLGTSLKDQLETVRRLAPLIRAVHVNPGDEQDEFLHGKVEKTVTWRILQELKEVRRVEGLLLVGEYAPCVTTRQHNLQDACAMRDILHHFVRS